MMAHKTQKDKTPIKSSIIGSLDKLDTFAKNIQGKPKDADVRPAQPVEPVAVYAKMVAETKPVVAQAAKVQAPAPAPVAEGVLKAKELKDKELAKAQSEAEEMVKKAKQQQQDAIKEKEAAQNTNMMKQQKAAVKPAQPLPAKVHPVPVIT